MNQPAERAVALRDRVRGQLEAERQRLLEEIRTYPTPIPRCDQQFNYLIERRERLSSELARFDAAVAPASAKNDGGWLAAFIDASPCLEPDLKLRLKAALAPGPVAESTYVPGG